MTLTTPCANLPYPEDSDPIDVAGDMAALALAADTAICGVGGMPVGAIIAWYDTGGAPPSGKLRCDGSSFSGATYPELETHLGGTTLPDLRGRFLRGTDAAGGAWPTNGTLAGWADSIVVAHTHGQPVHTHDMAHDHAMPHTHSTGQHAHSMGHTHSIAHDHGAANTSTTGSHSHEPSVTTEAFVTVATPGSVGFELGPGSQVVNQRSNTDSEGSHFHSFNMPNYNGTSGASSNTNTGSSSAGTSGSPSPGDTDQHTGRTGQDGNENTTSTGQSGTNRNTPPFYNITFLMQAVKGTEQ